ncbi:MAG: hypothetical protein V3U96_09200 [Paracoccaceae bacterium]
MKPSFALNLSHQGLSLLRRAKNGWQIIGSAELDDPDLTARLQYLRKTAAELASGQLASKLVIPNSEILYRTIDVPDTADTPLKDAVRQALDGATPYPVDDLAYDFVDAGNSKVHIAAVAHDTLNEAESFAIEHGFNPVSYVATPKRDDFVGEPFFGETKLCKSILPAGETVEPDPGPIIITSDHDPNTAAEPLSTPENVAVPKPKPKQNPTAEIKPDHDDLSEFSSSRMGLAENGTAPSDLGKLSPRFMLYADKKQQGPDTDVKVTAPPPKIMITAMAVTAPDLAGEDATPDLKPAKTKKPAKPNKPKAAKTAKPVKSTAKVTAKESQRTAKEPAKPAPTHIAPAQTAQNKQTVYDLRAADRVDTKPKAFMAAMVLGGAALILFAVLISSFAFDRPIAVSRLWDNFTNTPSQFEPEALTTPQIVASSIDPVLPESAIQPIVSAPQNLGTLPPGSDAVNATLTPADLVATPIELAETPPDPYVEITLAEADVIYNSTGYWVMDPVPPVSLTAAELEDFYVASIDPLVISHDALALPATRTGPADIQLGDMGSPAAFGTVFDLDEQGFVRATPSGALSADGILITLGSPAITPRLRPNRATDNDAPAIALAQIPRTPPTPRPKNLIQSNERSQLGGRTRAELAQLRPLPRPASPQDTDQSINLAPTELASLSSPLPKIRPANFAATVQSARDAAQKAAVNSALQNATAAVAAPSAPTIPTTASVAREATIENAINLSSRVNLIGVYGSSSDRRALVRLKSGRYVKVQIGDRLDGGKVAAIDGTKLQYIKGGRLVTLDIAS